MSLSVEYINAKQKDIFLEYLIKYQDLRALKGRNADALWDEMTIILNNVPGGARKIATDWRKTWKYIKSQARLKLQRNNGNREKLSSFQRKLIDRLDNIPETTTKFEQKAKSEHQVATSAEENALSVLLKHEDLDIDFDNHDLSISLGDLERIKNEDASEDKDNTEEQRPTSYYDISTTNRMPTPATSTAQTENMDTERHEMKKPEPVIEFPPTSSIIKKEEKVLERLEKQTKKFITQTRLQKTSIPTRSLEDNDAKENYYKRKIAILEAQQANKERKLKILETRMEIANHSLTSSYQIMEILLNKLEKKQE